MVDRDGHPVVIDMENLLCVDVEWVTRIQTGSSGKTSVRGTARRP